MTQAAAGSLHRLSAFGSTPEGGNPAGVWIGDRLPDAAAMQHIAARVGYSETIFLAPREGFARTVRYFSPEAEVSFCGHATIAAGVLLGETTGDGEYHFATAVGDIPVAVGLDGARRTAALTSVAPEHAPAPADLIREALRALRWDAAELDGSIPPARAYAGAWHLILAASTRERLARLDYDFDTLRELMLHDGLTTLQLVHREALDTFRSRNPFPVGGVVEDPATGAAAAALGGYLRDAGLIEAPTRIVIRQGEEMGRPSLLVVDIPDTGGVVVSGGAVRIE